MVQIIVFLLVALVVTAIMMRDQLAEWLRLSRSRNWPLTSATIEGGEIAIFKGKYGTTFTVTLSYSYHVDGQYYSGYHIQDFDSEPDAESDRHRTGSPGEDSARSQGGCVSRGAVARSGSLGSLSPTRRSWRRKL